jgi:excisionase family DNA binding protein
MSDYLTFEEAAEFLSTPHSTLYRWLREGRVPGHKLGRRWRFLRVELEALRQGGPGVEERRGLEALAAWLGSRSETEKPMDPQPRVLAERLLWDASDAGATAIHLQPTGALHEVRHRTSAGLETLTTLSAEVFDALDREWIRRSRPVRGERKRRLFLERGEGAEVVRLQVRYRRVETFLGERITLRLLREDRMHTSIDRIAPLPADADALRRFCVASHGLVLISGRSGSGKTTTAYACLAEIAAKGGRVLFTLEDTIGTYLSGVDQLEVEMDDERAFRAAFEAVMDSDPDVVFVASTIAQPHREALWGLALSAAEAGHLVFVQVEADSVADAATRFISALDRPPGACLIGAVWQELVPAGDGRETRYEFM